MSRSAVSRGFLCQRWLLRRGIQETAEGAKAATMRPPLIPSLIADWLPMLRAFGILATTNAAYYLTFTFAVDWRKGASHEPATFLLANTLSLVVLLTIKPIGGWLSDYIGRRRMMLTLPAATMGIVVPALRIMLYGTVLQFMLGQMLLAVPLGLALGLQVAMVVEIFPLRTRVASMSIAYSLTMALAAGSAPLVSTWLIDRLHQPLAPAYYIVVHGLLGLALMLPMSETNARPLDA